MDDAKGKKQSIKPKEDSDDNPSKVDLSLSSVSKNPVTESSMIYCAPKLPTPKHSVTFAQRKSLFQKVSSSLPQAGPRNRGTRTTIEDLQISSLLSRINDQERQEWTSRKDFNFACLGYVVGLGNFAKFPMVVFKNGGGGFLVPYMMMVIFVAVPIFYLEVALGQYTSLGPTKCWEFCPIAQGVGYAIAFCNFLSTIWYIIIISWALIYFVRTFYNNPLPWSHCGEWSSKNCIDNIIRINESVCLARNGTPCQKGSPCESGDPCLGGFGTCKIANKTDRIVIWDAALAASNDCKINSAAYEYYITFITGKAYGYHITHLGEINNTLLISFLISWVFMALLLMLGIRFQERFSVATAVIQYVALPILFVKGLFLDGSRAGIIYYLTPHTNSIFIPRIWATAAKHVFYGNALAQGGVINLASYRKFHNSVLGDSVFNVFSDTFVGFWAGLIVFSFLGYLANYEGIDISLITSQGISLVFGEFTSALVLMPYSILYHVCFYSLVIIKGFGSQMVKVDITRSAVLDEWPSLREHPRIFICGICFVFFLLGLPFTAYGGDDIITLISDSIADIYLICGILLCVSIGWCYKANRFINDIEIMAGHPLNFFSKWYFIISWKFTIPIILLAVLFISFSQQPLYPQWPTWLHVIRWLITSINFLAIFGVGFHNVRKTHGSGFEKVKNATKPTKFWGPAKLHNRAQVIVHGK